jgi:hypothetical protein
MCKPVLDFVPLSHIHGRLSLLVARMPLSRPLFVSRAVDTPFVRLYKKKNNNYIKMKHTAIIRENRLIGFLFQQKLHITEMQNGGHSTKNGCRM